MQETKQKWLNSLKMLVVKLAMTNNYAEMCARVYSHLQKCVNNVGRQFEHQ